MININRIASTHAFTSNARRNCESAKNINKSENPPKQDLSNNVKSILKSSTVPVLMLSSLVACNPDSGKKDCFECSNNGVEKTVVVQDPQEEIAQDDRRLKKVKMTNGTVINRDPKEIEKITGLRPKEFEVLNKAAMKLINDRYANELGKFYFTGTTYKWDLIFPSSFSINYTNGDKNIKMLWDDEKKTFKVHSVNWGDGILKLKIEREKNNDFSLISTVDKKTEILNFTQNGILKDMFYLPGENNYTEQSQYDQTKNIESDIKNIKFFENNNTEIIARFINALGLSNVEYISSPKSNIFFISGKDCSYRLNVKKLDGNENTIIGIANKVTNSGKSEIYLFKGEMLSTNKSDKLIISKMRVVQDGLSDDDPVKNKHIKETQKTGNNTSTSSHKLDGTATTPWLRNLFSTSHNKFYDGDISSKTVNQIDELITEVNSDLKTIKIVSIDKRNGNVTIQGN